jgi:hypothetical protein
MTTIVKSPPQELEPILSHHEEEKRRLMYLNRADRRHTTNRGKTLLIQRPDLMQQLRSYYGDGDMRSSEEKATDDKLAAIGVQTTNDSPHMAFYTNKAILQRESLRFDPDILSILEDLWQVTDSSHDGKVVKAEYVKMSSKLYLAIIPKADQHEEDMIKIAEVSATVLKHNYGPLTVSLLVLRMNGTTTDLGTHFLITLASSNHGFS